MVTIIKKTGAALIAGELVTIDDDTFNLMGCAAGKFLGGICAEAKGSSDITQTRYDRLRAGDIVRCKVATGTAALSEVGNYVDIASSTTGVTTTESSKDGLVVGFPMPGYLDVQFVNLLSTFGPTLATVSD
jgi:hypothetical protein